MSRIISNARIESTTLGHKASDGKCFSSCISLDYGGTGQSFGGFAFDAFNKAVNRRVGCDWGMEFIARLLETVGVDSWEELVGKHIRVDHEEWGPIHRVGHIIDDKWFDPKEDLKFLLEEKAAQ